ncbi:MAG: hypothetical protein RL556_127 [Actinomycetota bacterium]
MRKPAKLGQAFNRLYASATASHIADGVLSTAAPLLATTLTQDPILIAGIAALAMLPWLLFGIPLGALVDRVNRRLALAIASGVKFSAAAGISLAIATGHMNIWVLYVATFLIGTTEVVSDTAMQSMIPKLLKKNQLETGNSRLSIAQTILGTFIGTPLGGLLYAVAIWVPFAFNAAGFLVSALLLLLIPIKVKKDFNRASDTSHREPTHFVEDIKVGILHLWNDKKLLRLVITTASIGFTFNVGTATMVLFILNVLHVPAAYFGLIFTLEGVSGLISSIQAASLSKRFGRGRVLAISITLCPLVIGLQGFATNIYFFVAMLVIFGYLISLWNILLMSTYHELIPNEMFGRVHGTRRTLVWGLMPFGSMIGGWIATFDLHAPFFVTGIFGTLIGLSAMRFISKLQPKKLAEDNCALAIL